MGGKVRGSRGECRQTSFGLSSIGEDADLVPRGQTIKTSAHGAIELLLRYGNIKLVCRRLSIPPNPSPKQTSRCYLAPVWH